ncbi:MAG: M67 family metallopeptidase [Candidatus Bathyarchaeota archaeon]|nr:MAG: M67 family metallopeptidase [Candidatus Bathyarchaeota archaeon]
MILRLTPNHVALLRQETRRVYPIEACALLFGHLNETKTVVRRVFPVPNRLESASRFEVDPETFVRLNEEAEADGMSFVGLFHSHAAPATPSPTDLKFMKLWGTTIWLILSTITDDIAAFQIVEGNLSSLAIEVDD